ncbi:MAG: hypothetical protein AAFO57_00840 [Pseudomonadota bacterium]
MTWYIDGEPTDKDAAGLHLWRPKRAGFYTVSAVDAQGRSSRVRVRVIGLPPA